MLFLDTNVLLRHITQDNLDQSARARSLLEQIGMGEMQATTCEVVIAEVVFVLSSKTLYNVPRPKIRDDLRGILSLRGLKLPHKRTYVRALEIYASINIDFADAIIVAHMERTKVTTLASFDRHFDRVPGIMRTES